MTRRGLVGSGVVAVALGVISGPGGSHAGPGDYGPGGSVGLPSLSASSSGTSIAGVGDTALGDTPPPEGKAILSSGIPGLPNISRSVSSGTPASPGVSFETARMGSPGQEFGNVPYDGAYTFVRVRFNMGGRRMGGRGFGRGGGPPWAHDFPFADNNFVQILDEVTLLGPQTGGTNVMDADSPELHRYPVAYISEPGYWSPTRAEIDNVAAYLQKGGFLILDDFRGAGEWNQVEAIFNAILPGHRFRQLTVEEPIFNSFFEIESLDFSPPTFRQYTPYFLGIHEGDDPSNRLLVIANFNNDIGDYWEYSDLGYFPIDLSNEAYKVGVNYIIYALTR